MPYANHITVQIDIFISLFQILPIFNSVSYSSCYYKNIKYHLINYFKAYKALMLPVSITHFLNWDATDNMPIQIFITRVTSCNSTLKGLELGHKRLKS